jgi:chorismate synthase
MSSSLGKLLRLTTFGESHGPAIGGIIDGFPANFPIDFEAIQKELDRRKPGQSAIVTQRKEADEVQFLSGIFEGKTTGHPISFQILNTNQRSQDYSEMSKAYRPSHADFVYDQKYGIRDPRGGGRSSARETASWVVAGALAKQFLKTKGIEIDAFVDQVGALKWDGTWNKSLRDIRESNPVRVPDLEVAAQMEALIREIRKQGDTIGGCISAEITGLPIGLGEPIFDKLNARLGHAMLSINAVKGFSLGSGFDSVSMKGSEHNDIFNSDGTTSEAISTKIPTMMPPTNAPKASTNTMANGSHAKKPSNAAKTTASSSPHATSSMQNPSPKASTESIRSPKTACSSASSAAK